MDIALPARHVHPSRFHTFMQIAMFLAIVTGAEIIIIFIPLTDWIVYTTLAVLSAVKFLAVIFYFMHLRWDRVFCTVLFFIGLILGGGTLAALIALFHTDRTEAAADAAAQTGQATPPSAWVASVRT
jgi:cytochrome c oxidase subunit IV